MKFSEIAGSSPPYKPGKPHVERKSHDLVTPFDNRHTGGTCRLPSRIGSRYAAGGGHRRGAKPAASGRHRSLGLET